MRINILVGARFQAKLLANFFQKNNYDSVVYTSSPSSKWVEKSLPGTKKINFIPMPFQIVAKLLKYLNKRSLKEFDTIIFDKLASFFMRDSDILHCWATFSLDSSIKWKRKNKYIILERACPHVHYQNELLSEEAEKLGINFEQSSPEFIERCISEYDLADKIIVPSKYSYDSFVEKGFSKEKLELIRLDANFSPVNHEFVKTNDTFIVGSVGGNVLRKGFIYLIEAWQNLKLKNAKLLLKTNVSELKKSDLIWNKIKDDKTIEIVGYMKNIEDFYRECDLFCLPSIDDGFGMVVMESLACSKPVIATKHVGASEMIIDGKTGYIVNNRDVAAIAFNIKKLYNDRDLLNTMSQNALDYYLDYKNSTENYETQMSNLYMRIKKELEQRKFK